MRPGARIVRRAVVAPDAGVREALRLDARAKALHLSRLRLLDGRAVLAEEIWLSRDDFAPLATLPLADFGDLLYPLYERLCRKVVASARETLRVGQADAAVARTLAMKLGHPVIRVDRLASDFAGRPVECRSTVGAADGFQYEVDIR